VVPYIIITVDAFVAMGGNPDKSGQIRAEKLVKTIKEFQLTIDIEARFTCKLD